jgi:hypothetical protein
MMLLHSKTAAPCFGIRHTQETSVHQWSTHPPTKRHPTAARQNSLLYINSIETLICHGISKKKPKKPKQKTRRADSHRQEKKNKKIFTVDCKTGGTTKNAVGDDYCTAVVAISEMATRLIVVV